MIKIRVSKPMKITLNGHADYAEKGSDIVCASATMLAYTFFMGLKVIEKRGADIGVKSKFEEGRISVSCDVPNHDSEIVLATVLAGYKLLEENYPNNIKIFSGTFLENKPS